MQKPAKGLLQGASYRRFRRGITVSKAQSILPSARRGRVCPGDILFIVCADSMPYVTGELVGISPNPKNAGSNARQEDQGPSGRWTVADLSF